MLRYAPIGYWPLWDASGSQAMDLSGNGRHGSHVGVTLAQHKKQFVCPFYDGALDYTNIYSTSFRDAFDGSEGTVMIWAKVADAGVWTDGNWGVFLQLRADNGNKIVFRKMTSNNTLQISYYAGGVSESEILWGVTTTDWICLSVTWSKSAGVDGEVKYFLDGVQQGATDTALGVWAGNLAATWTVIGARTTGAGDRWHGYLAHCAVWGRALSPVAMADLAEA